MAENHHRTKLRELGTRTWLLLLIFVVAVGGWFLLSHLALQARTQSGVPNTVDYQTAKGWATDLLGLAGTFAGFLGIIATGHRSGLDLTERAEIAAAGMAGVLAGATLLGVGSWQVPTALAILVAGAATLRVVRALREPQRRSNTDGTRNTN
jgi:hypothetical protein